MFGKKAKKETVINNLQLNKANSLKQKHQDKLNKIGMVIKYKLLDDYCDFIKSQLSYYTDEFNKVDYINVTHVEFADSEEFQKIYDDFLNFLKVEEDFFDFLENNLIISLRTKYGFNPLEDNELLTTAIQLEHGNDVKINNDIELSPE
jgi:hypothetical protein